MNDQNYLYRFPHIPYEGSMHLELATSLLTVGYIGKLISKRKSVFFQIVTDQCKIPETGKRQFSQDTILCKRCVLFLLLFCFGFVLFFDE